MVTLVRKEYLGGTLQTTLSGSIDSAVTAAALTDGSTFPNGASYPFVVEFDRGVAGLSEKVLVTSRSGNAFAGMTRGYDGTTAIAHTPGASVSHIIDATTFVHLWEHISDPFRDDHTQYLSSARHDLTARHTIGTVIPAGTTPLATAIAAVVGSANTVARGDHVHAIGAASIPAGSFVPSAIAAADIASSAVTTAKIFDANVTTAKIADANVTRAKLETNEQMPIGSITMFGGAAAPAGWLLCDGSSVLRAGTYANLFAIIGTTFGSVDGTHFTLPDMRDKSVIGTSGTKALGTSGGAATIALTSTQLPAHTHTFSGTTSTDGSHTHVPSGADDTSVFARLSSSIESSAFPASGTRSTFTPLVAAGSHSHTLSGTSGSAGTGSAFSLLDPYISVNYIIKY